MKACQLTSTTWILHKTRGQAFVYKCMTNGDLYDWLHPNRNESNTDVMPWHVRAKVAIGLARGLAWLHQGSNTRIIHLDLCSKCVLLDQDIEPKISNSGDAMFVGSDRIASVQWIVIWI